MRRAHVHTQKQFLWKPNTKIPSEKQACKPKNMHLMNGPHSCRHSTMRMKQQTNKTTTKQTIYNFNTLLMIVVLTKKKLIRAFVRSVAQFLNGILIKDIAALVRYQIDNSQIAIFMTVTHHFWAQNEMCRKKKEEMLSSMNIPYVRVTF